MPNVPVAATIAKSNTTTAGSTDVVTFERAYGLVEVVNRGSADIWVWLDRNGRTPSAAAAGADGWLPINGGGRRVLVDDAEGAGAPAPVSVVRVFAATAVPYTAAGFNS